MNNIAKACYRAPFQKMQYFEGTEETLSTLPFDKEGYVISNFEGTEFQFIHSKPKYDKINFQNNHNPGFELEYTIDKEFFIDYINKIQSTIKTGVLSKVVACRCKQIELPEQFEINNFIDKLTETYPNAYISVYQGSKNTYISATPELLIKKDENGESESVALAGTATWEQRENLGKKESEEQEIIVTHAIETFKKLGISFDESDKYLVQAGHLAHLVNKFTFNLNKIKLSEFLKAYHPTPAIGLYPHSAGIDFITQNEGWDRGFYTGYSGVINPLGITTFSINIRSMIISGNKALLQAGAGITKDSVAEKEWLETEEKMKTIENLLK